MSQKLLNRGQILQDRYRIIELVGKGGMGLVYKVRDLSIEETIALKVLKPGKMVSPEMVDKFKHEIKLTRKIKNPHVCQIYNFDSSDGLMFISMEFISGNPLTRLINAGNLTYHKKYAVVQDVLMGLAAAHNEQIIHQDFKPDNIMIDGKGRAIIMDFGIANYAELLNRERGETEEFFGTPYYMSPEAFQGDPIDNRSDIYSLGVVLYQLFTGQLPFTGDNAIAIALQHIQKKPIPPSQKCSQLDTLMEEIILKCLEKEPEKRFSSVAEIVETLGLKECSEEAFESHTVHTNGTTHSRVEILVVDDDPCILLLLKSVLEPAGYVVYTAENGGEAIEQATQRNPSLIIMDIMMPILDGYQAAEFLRNNPSTSHIPIIILTCKSDSDYVAYSRSIGAQRHLAKPFQSEDLLNCVEEILFC